MRSKSACAPSMDSSTDPQGVCFPSGPAEDRPAIVFDGMTNRTGSDDRWCNPATPLLLPDEPLDGGVEDDGLLGHTLSDGCLRRSNRFSRITTVISCFTPLRVGPCS